MKFLRGQVYINFRSGKECLLVKIERDDSDKLFVFIRFLHFDHGKAYCEKIQKMGAKVFSRDYRLVKSKGKNIRVKNGYHHKSHRRRVS